MSDYISMSTYSLPSGNLTHILVYNIAHTDQPPRIVAILGDLADAFCFDELEVTFTGGKSLAIQVELKNPVTDEDRVSKERLKTYESESRES